MGIWNTVRNVVTLLFFILLVVSIVNAKNAITNVFRAQQAELALYAKSPNCDNRGDQSQIDPTLPPCVYVTEAVIGKPQRRSVDHYRYHDYPREYDYLTLQDSTGHTRTLGTVTSRFWDSVRIGDQVTVKTLSGKVIDVTDGDSSSIVEVDDGSWNPVIFWAVTGVVSMSVVCLRFGWVRRRRSFLDLTSF